MLHINKVKGVVFDVDETLLDTGLDDRKNAVHEQARLQATYEAGRKYNLPALLAVTPEENINFFLDSPVHSLEGALWYMLYVTGTVDSDLLDPSHPLLRELAVRKNILAELGLRERGKPVAGAVEFITWLAEDHGLKDRLAIASTASRTELDIFLAEITSLKQYFPDARIFSKDNITHHKPHPEAFDKAFLSLGLPDSARSRVLAFEDNPRGIRSAKEAGLYTCAITTIHSRAHLAALEVPPDVIADSFAEFRRLLDQA